jgi:hypothetical protein
MKKTISIILVAVFFFAANMYAVNVRVNADKSIQNSTVVRTIESRLSALLTEINDAQRADRPLNFAGLDLGAEARQTLIGLWTVAHFYCDDEEVTDRLWNFKQSYMVRSIPLIIVPDAVDSWANGTYQEAVVEFDRNGRITDFRFSFGSQLGETMERCSGSVVETERKMEILSWCDRLRTAYNKHDSIFMEKVFSDNALIITGKVVTETNREFGTTNEKVIYNKLSKRQYLTKLKECFHRNKWISVEFDEIGVDGLESGCATVTKSNVNADFYGVRLHQKWRSTNYNDDGYVFILWNFQNENRPQIEVRTWQPDMVNGKKMDSDDIFSLSDFEADIKNI